MVVVGSLAWWLQVRPALIVDGSSLSEIPTHLGSWKGNDIPIETVVESLLRTDASLQREYVHTTGELVWVYVGYYGTDRGGRAQHTPRGCYASQGWAIVESRKIESGGDTPLRANEYLVERDGERRLVHFWYRSHRRGGMLGGLDQNLDRLLGRLFGGRADGALVRLSTPMREPDPSLARARLIRLGAQLDAQLAARWPSEREVR